MIVVPAYQFIVRVHNHKRTVWTDKGSAGSSFIEREEMMGSRAKNK